MRVKVQIRVQTSKVLPGVLGNRGKRESISGEQDRKIINWGNRQHKKTNFLFWGNRGTSQFISGDPPLHTPRRASLAKDKFFLQTTFFSDP